MTKRFGIANIVYNPLAGGILTGKQGGSEGPLTGTRFDNNKMYLDRYWHSEFFGAVEDLKHAQHTRFGDQRHREIVHEAFLL